MPNASSANTPAGMWRCPCGAGMSYCFCFCRHCSGSFGNRIQQEGQWCAQPQQYNKSKTNNGSAFRPETKLLNGRLRCGGDGGAVGGVQCDQMVLLFVKIGTGLQNKNNVTDF